MMLSRPTPVMHHENLESLLVLPTEEWQQDNVQLSVVTGDEGKVGNSYVCLRLQGRTKALFTKLKAYFKMVL